MTAGGREVRVLHVVGDHAVRAETPSERRDRVLHAANPTNREAVFVAVVEHRNDFVFERFEEVGVVAFVHNAQVGVDRAVADGETVRTVVGFRPPTVENGEVERAVEDDLLAARPGRFERTTRVVEPNVDALHQAAPDVDVVIFEEDDALRELRIALERDDAADDRFAEVVGRVRFTGENELHRAFRVVDDAVEALFVLNDEVSALVFGEATGETDRQRFRIEDRSRLGDRVRRRVAF